ncbi:MAG: ABC transporter permease [Deltaproteobacteria bacterium]|nr:MAG: ABC transporter permease [Deltaproteobacteria bacterium]
MRASKLFKLARSNLVRELGALAVSSGGVALGIGCLVFFLALGAGLQGVVNEVFPVSTREVEVVVPSMAIGNLLGEARLDDAVVARLRKVPGVAAAYPKMSLRIPAVTRYNGLFFGREIHMGLEVVGVGLMPELVGEDARLPFQDRGDGAPIPIVVSRRLLEIYNKVFAPQRGLPRLTDSMLIGFQFPIELGRSYIAGKTMPNAQEAALQLVGFSDRATLAGASMPLTAVMRINRRYGADADNYSSVLLRAQNADQVPEVAASVRRMGLEIDDSERNRALQIGAAVELVTLALGILAGLITGLAAVNTMQAFYASVRERTREIGVLRAVGATRGDVAGVVLAEAAVTGLAGGVVGVLLARLAAALLDRVASNGLPDFPFKPSTFFRFQGWHVALGILVALAAALIGAFFPARAAARLDPAKALTES